MLADIVWNQELRVFRPAIVPLGETDLLLAQGRTVGCAGVLLVGRTVGDVTVDDDQCGSGRGALERVESPLEHFEVVGVPCPGDVPTVSDKARRHVLGERPIRVAFDGDLVVVVNPAEIRQPKMTREGGRFR